MIIDQLPLLLGDALLTDEFPIERGTTSYKATLEQILGVAFSEIEPNFAGAYDSTATYAVGDYVVYEHDLYVCNTAISTAEAWTAAHWTQTDIGTVLESLKSDIDNKQDALVSGANIKTLNGASILGSGDMAVGGALYFTSVACSAMTGDFATVSNANITANFVVASVEFSNPSAITSDISWTTGAGALVLNGTCASATTADIVLVMKNN